MTYYVCGGDDDAAVAASAFSYIVDDVALQQYIAIDHVCPIGSTQSNPILTDLLETL